MNWRCQFFGEVGLVLFVQFFQAVCERGVISFDHLGLRNDGLHELDRRQVRDDCMVVT